MGARKTKVHQGAIISRVLSPRTVSLRTSAGVAAIHLLAGLLRRSSSQPGPLGAKHAYPSCERRETPIRPCSGWGLPCGCCCQPPGALLPHPFTLACAPLSGKPSAVCSLWHFPLPSLRRAGGRYPPPLFRGARTFLAPRRTRGCLRPPDGGRYRRASGELLFLFAASLVLKTGSHFSARCFTASAPDRGRAAIATGSRRSRHRGCR